MGPTGMYQHGQTHWPRVFAQMVPRCTPNCFASAVALTPLARAVRIASTSLSVSRVRVRLLGSADAAMSGSSGSPTGLTATPDP